MQVPFFKDFDSRISFKRKKPDKNVFGILLIELKKDLNILGIKWDSAVQILIYISYGNKKYYQLCCTMKLTIDIYFLHQ